MNKQQDSGVFTIPARRCKRCGGLLTSEQAIKDGYGSCCLRKMRQEARAKEEAKKSVQPIRQRGGTGVNERYREVCENRDWSVTVFDDGTVELEKYSPAGEDFIVAVDAENFVENVKKYAADFDPDEHIEMWVMARHNGAKGVPSIRELVHDAEDIDKMLQELAAALQEAEDSAA